jgi:hypothetical protein
MSKIRTFNQYLQRNDCNIQIMRKKSRYENAYLFNMQIDEVVFSYIFEMYELWRSTYSRRLKLCALSSNRNQIEKKWSCNNNMSDTIIQKIRFLHYNCARSTNTRISCLKYDLEKNINITCMQKSWLKSN